jgi:uncharacterized protein YdcH (DUF465 family)
MFNMFSAMFAGFTYMFEAFGTGMHALLQGTVYVDVLATHEIKKQELELADEIEQVLAAIAARPKPVLIEHDSEEV